MALYDELLAVQDTPVVALNRAVAVAMAAGPAAALPALDELAGDPVLAGSHRVRAVRADVNRRAGRMTAAIADYDRALELAGNQAERRFLARARRQAEEAVAGQLPAIEPEQRRAEPPMPHAEHTVTISRPPQEVFDYLADGTHNREWRAGVLEISRTSAGDGQGATYRQVLAGPGGRRIDGDYQITVFDPPRRLEFRVTAGPARPAGVFELTGNAAGSTRVRFSLDLDPAGVMKLMTPIITREMRREVAQLDNLKAILERTP